ncbi:unnamed protein product [Kuraishia capsulata CBS 1993]|uniref:LrgB-like protein n=1 Tax=Kuraishia capsulata CBS 1993 TaxID=1382522 RepID=W6MXD3_9ASCO|nr:uncharacterized protein KUCA_T00004674001 [Kuraishia capsulata CBS 1993]CDK28690.1 unnamed protein product [Kuraishia capsulata CBS 1993]
MSWQNSSISRLLSNKDIKYLFRSYALVPIGIILYLMILYGIQRIIQVIGIRFPSSVCLMLIQFIGLSLLALIFGEKKIEVVLKVLEVPCGFSLRWMNVYFIPAFVVLPLSKHIGVGGAFTICGIFVIGYLAMFALIAYLTLGLEIVQNYLAGKISKRKTPTDSESGAQESKQELKPEFKADSNGTIPELDSATTTASEESQDIATDLENHIEGEALMEQLTQIDQIDTNAAVDRFSRTHGVVVRNLCQVIDWSLYTICFIVGIVVYFTTGYELPYQLGVTVLLFKTCMLIPPRWRRFAHPILISFAVELLIILIFTEIRGQGFLDSLRDYKTGRTYLHLFDGKNYPKLPGCGDLLSSLMDVSIVSLSIPMYRYRMDLKKNFLVLTVPILVCAAICFFCYPPIVSRLGLSDSMALGFTGRSVTLALGTPLVANLGGNQSLMACSTVISGIIGVISGEAMLKLLRLDSDMVEGVTLGLNCGAVSTSHLLTVNPKAASVSSLSFTLFGTVMVIWSSINPLVRTIKDLLV